MRPLRRLLDRLTAPRKSVAEVVELSPLDLLDSSFVRNPYAVYARLRVEDPVHRTRSGAWMLTRYRDIVSALANPALGNAPSRFAVLSARNRERYVSADIAHNILPFLDKPDHIVPRRIIAGAFRAHLKENPLDAAELARHLLKPHLASGRMDAMADFGKPLSVEVISRLMGLPPRDYARLVHWSDHFFYLFAPMPSDEIRQRTDAALSEFRLYFKELVEQRRSRPGTDLISRLIQADDDGQRLSEMQVIDTCLLLFSDGVENVDAGIANILLALHQHPTELARLRTEPEQLPAAVLEGLRYDSPAQFIARVAREDMEIGGQTIRRDSGVFLALGSANRDPETFERPDVFDPSRDATPLLTFGKGRHSCIGATLVRHQIEGALRALFEETRAIEVDPSALDWTPRAGHRWLKALPLRLKA